MSYKEYVISAIVLDTAVILTNVVEIVLLAKKWDKLDRIEHLLFSLAIADFVSGIAMLGLDITQLSHLMSNGKFKMSTVETLTWECLFLFLLVVSNLHVLSIAIERLVAVVVPLKYHIFTTRKCKAGTICLVWTLSLIVAPTITVILKTTYDKVADQEYIGHYIVAGTLLFACVSVFTIYFCLAVALLIRERRAEKLLPEEIHKHFRDRKTTMFCLLIGLSFVVCILPTTLGVLDDSMHHNVSSLLITLNHLLNPFIYFAKTYFAKLKRTHSTRKRLLSRARLISTADSICKTRSNEEIRIT